MQPPLSRRSLAVIAAVLSVFLPPRVFASPQSKEDSSASNTVRCVLTVESRTWKKGSPANIAVKVENLTEASLNLKIVPEFFLEGDDEYSAPTDIVHNKPIGLRQTLMGSKGPVEMRVIQLNLHLDSMSTSTFEVDATKTKWARTVSSVWPSQALSTLPSGHYSLRLEFTDAAGKAVTSNRISVNLED
jgi:hypothetical protein